MKLFTKKEKVIPNVHDRVLVDIPDGEEVISKWHQESPYIHRRYKLVEAIVLEISPSKENYLLQINDKNEWYNHQNIYFVEILSRGEKI